MKKKHALSFGLIAVIVSFIAAVFFLLRDGRKSVASRARDFNYILITVDTLRADRIGCYGFTGIDTPTMDMFAARGVRFERCIAQTPLTLPSHTSIMTGTQPLFHGVRDNGGFLVPQELSTLAEIMKDNGYQTSAFVAAYVLDSKWGLNQGFDFYFDRFDLSKYKTVSLGNVQRRGDEIVQEAMSWLDKHKHERFFTWIHLYDPHTPYEPPSPFKERYPNRPYVGEIAYTDSQLGRLWQYLEDNGLVEKTILVFASDHGESLGEHQESTHGFFIYQAGVHVPLIFVTPFAEFQGLSRSEVASLVDIMPTLLELAGLPVPPQVQGKSLLASFGNGASDEDGVAYCETYYPRFHYGWSELQSVQDRRFKLIAAPRLELYDLENDPGELRNLVDDQPAEARRLLNVLESLSDEAAQDAFELDYSHMDEESRQKLAALGYIGSFTDAASLEGRRQGDPKDKIIIFNQLSEARELSLQNRFEEAAGMIADIIAVDPDVIDAYFALGNLYYKEGKYQEAVDTFYKVLEKKPNDNFTVINIANAYIQMDRLDEAEKAVLGVLENLTPDSQVQLILGNIKNYKKEYREAVPYYEKCIDLNPASASAYNALGGVFVILEELEKAESYLQKALEINPKLRRLHYNLAQLHEARGDMPKAIDAYLQELENMPFNFRASFNLARLYRLRKETEAEFKYLEKTIESNPGFPLSYFYLARIHLNRGENYRDAISLVEKGLSLKPEKEHLPLGYFLMADLYNRLGDPARSAEYVQKGRQAQQDISK